MAVENAWTESANAPQPMVAQIARSVHVHTRGRLRRKCAPETDSVTTAPAYVIPSTRARIAHAQSAPAFAVGTGHAILRTGRAAVLVHGSARSALHRNARHIRAGNVEAKVCVSLQRMPLDRMSQLVSAMLDSMGQTALSKSAHKTAQGVEHAHNQVENANAMQDSMGRHVIRSALDSMPLQMKAEATIALVMAAVPTTTAFVMSGGLAGLTRLARSADARERTTT